jgi:hypothetical protein
MFTERCVGPFTLGVRDNRTACESVMQCNWAFCNSRDSPNECTAGNIQIISKPKSSFIQWNTHTHTHTHTQHTQQTDYQTHTYINVITLANCLDPVISSPSFCGVCVGDVCQEVHIFFVKPNFRSLKTILSILFTFMSWVAIQRVGTMVHSLKRFVNNFSMDVTIHCQLMICRIVFVKQTDQSICVFLQKDVVIWHLVYRHPHTFSLFLFLSLALQPTILESNNKIFCNLVNVDLYLWFLLLCCGYRKRNCM